MGMFVIGNADLTVSTPDDRSYHSVAVVLEVWQNETHFVIDCEWFEKEEPGVDLAPTKDRPKKPP
jgi:hypothetical protein